MIIKNNTICTLGSQYFYLYHSIVLYALLSVVYVIVTFSFIKHPKSFHPFFVLSFFLILLAYATSTSMITIRNTLEFLMEPNTFLNMLEYMFDYSAKYSQPVVVLTLLERLTATVFVNKYENTNYWIPYLIGQLLCFLIVIFITNSEKRAELISNIQFGLSLAICIVLIMLFTINRKMTENSHGKLSLTTRYQLAENIKALRIFVPFLLMDSFIAVMFVITQLTLSVARKFNELECKKSKSYVLFFVFFRTIAVIVQMLMAISVIHQHKCMKLWNPFRCIRRRSMKSEDISKRDVPQLQIQNVLGKNIRKKESAENYFAQLHRQWG